MADNIPTNFAPSVELVPVVAALPEERENAGSVIIMRDGSFRQIIRTGAVNLAMKSPPEQAGIAYGFGSLVNSLDVDNPLQIVAHSKRLDVEAYARQFDARLNNERTPPQIRRLIEAHIMHFEEHVKSNNLLQREFYVVVNWKGSSGPLKRGFTDDIPLAPLFKRVFANIEKRTLQHQPSDQEIAVARQQLDLRCELIEGRLQSMGIWTRRLNEEDIHKLLYEYYHPTLAERQGAPSSANIGRVVQGFSTNVRPPGRRSINDGRELEPPSF
jgi:hypothetical protein